jgi:hypothetical protein
VTKIIEHPNTRLVRKIEQQEKQIKALMIDVGVLRDLLTRTVQLLAKLEAESGLGKTFKLFK